MKKRNINNNIQMKVHRYLEYMNEEKINDGYSEEARTVIKKLPFILKSELNIDFYGKIFKKIEPINSNFSKEFISELCQNVKELKFIPGELIIENVEEIIIFLLK